MKAWVLRLLPLGFLAAFWIDLGALDSPGFALRSALSSWKPVLVEFNAAEGCTGLFGMNDGEMEDFASRHRVAYFQYLVGPKDPLARDLGVDTIVYFLLRNGRIVNRITLKEVNERAEKHYLSAEMASLSPNGKFLISPGQLERALSSIMEAPTAESAAGVQDLNRRLTRRTFRSPRKWIVAAAAAGLLFI